MEIIKIVQDGIELDVNGGEIDASSITQDADNRLVTDTEKTTWNNKQDKLTAGTNVTITGTTISATDTVYDDTALKTRITAVENREDKDTTYNVATTSANGLMSSGDKTKLNGIEAGAEKNNVTSTDISNWNNKVDKVSGKQLSTNDYTTAEKNKLNGIETGSQKNTVTSVQGRTGAVTVSKSDVGLSNVDNLSAASIRSGTTKSDVGLSNVDNVKQMPISGGVLEDYTEKLVMMTDGTIDLSLGNVFYAENFHTRTDLNFINAKNGSHSFTFIRGIGSATYVYPSNVKWSDGNIPELTYTSKFYVLTFMTIDGGTTWLGMFGGEF